MTLTIVERREERGERKEERGERRERERELKSIRMSMSLLYFVIVAFSDNQLEE